MIVFGLEIANPDDVAFIVVVSSIAQGYAVLTKQGLLVVLWPGGKLIMLLMRSERVERMPFWLDTVTAICREGRWYLERSMTFPRTAYLQQKRQNFCSE